MPPHHRSRKSPGAKPLTSQRDQYRALMRQGLEQRRGVPGRRRQPQDGAPLAIRPVGHDPHGRGADVPRDHESGAPGVGPLPVRGRADLDRGRSDPWPEPAHDRSRARSSTVHDQPGDPAQPGRRVRDVSPVPGGAPRRRPPGPSAPSEARPRRRAPDDRGRPPRAPLEPGAGQHDAAGALPRPARDARGARDDLPGALRARAGSPAPRRRAPASDRTGPPQAPPPVR